MGQLVAVTEKPSATPGVVRFELNRTLSGQGHERFRSVDDAVGASPSDELARRLFATGKVGGVHVYANMVTVDLNKGFDSDGLSIPKPLRFLFDPFGVALLPDIAHDYAIRHRHLLAPDRSVIDVPTRAEADEHFRRLTCEVNAMPGYARLLWVATRLGSWVAWRRWAREKRA